MHSVIFATKEQSAQKNPKVRTNVLNEDKYVKVKQ